MVIPLKHSLNFNMSVHRFKGRRISFLNGDAGPLALGAVLYAKLGNEKASRDCIKK